MKILFLLLDMPVDKTASNMYTDLIGEFKQAGHDLTVITPSVNGKSYIGTERGVSVLRVKCLPVLNVKSMIKKGLALALLPMFFKRAYNKHLKNSNFEWIFMPTPPITLIDFVSYLKVATGAKFYLILRDIHPQSAASIGLIKYKFMFNYLERRAKNGYELANLIGCMSKGNIDFIHDNYSLIEKKKLVLLKNWQKAEVYSKSNSDIRQKYGLCDKTIVLFGGNIGLGQKVENIHFLAKKYQNYKTIIFLIVGKGVKKEHLQEMSHKDNLDNVIFIDYLPRSEYLELVKSVDVGLISINENYAVPTCPSKLVSYMSLKVPIFAIINPGNDYGELIDESGSGLWSVGNNKEEILQKFEIIIKDKELREKMGVNGYNYFLSNLTADKAFKLITEQIENEKA